MFNFFDPILLSAITFLPLLGAIIILFLPGKWQSGIKWTAAFFTFIPLILAVKIFNQFDPAATGMQFQEGPFPWISSFNIHYFMGIDGISVSMILLTALLSFICIFASWGIKKAVKAYFALFLLLHTGMMGVFCSLDFFLFYIFWEVMLLPMYFLIGIWGGAQARICGDQVFSLYVIWLCFHVNCHALDVF